MPKKVFIPLLSVLLAAIVLLSPIAPVQNFPIPNPELSIGQTLDPSGNPFAHTFSDTKDIRTATYVVAASDSEHKYMADYRCDSTNDHLTIQAAIDALPDTGGEVFILDGTYNIEASLVLDSNQTLRGCGRNTILTTSTADLVFLSAVGGSGTEKTGIVIADLQIDGGAGSISDCGIYFEYVDYSFIQNMYLRRHNADPGGTVWSGIYLVNADFNQIVNNICQGNYYGVYLDTNSNNNTISGNTSQGNVGDPIHLYASSNNTVTSNTCQGNGYGIYISASNNNSIIGNISQGNKSDGISLDTSNNNTVTGNTCLENSQGANNNYSNIFLMASDYNLISGNTCRAPTIGTTLTVGESAGATDIRVTDTAGFEVGMGVVIDLGGVNVEYHRISAIAAGAPGVITIDAGLANDQIAGETIDVPEARYGINISNDFCDKNIIEGNDLHDAGKTANFNDVGTLTTVQDDNRDIEITQVRHYAYVKNTSGGDLAAGDVVVLKAVAAGNEITTTTTEGDQAVFGMVAEAIADTAYGYVQVRGKTTALKVDGTTDIAIGDLIGCFTTAKIGMKAAAGKMAFAIALEAYATNDSNGVIDALLITPRQAI